jgi:hydroxymethylpyrimidine/phosphomethylpyrimidine kinase
VSIPPTILVFGGHDPTGGAGLQADIETIGALGGHAVTVPTALTLQDTQQVFGFEAVSTTLFRQQAEMLLEEFPVAAIKIGMVGSRPIFKALHNLLLQHPTIPTVLDPVLAGGGGGALAENPLIEGIRTLLMPQSTLATPNRNELQRLVPEADSIEQRATTLLQSGCAHLLVTGTDNPVPSEAADRVHHQLFQADGTQQQFDNPRLPHSYHGSGCTLASAIATRIGMGDSISDAVSSGLQFSWNSLQQGYQPAQGQHFPNRFFLS